MSSRLHPCVGDLIAATRAGDHEARGALLSRYRRYLELVARDQIGRWLQGKADADDLVQETCLQAHRHFSSFRGHTEAEFVAWLRRILKRLLANHARHYLSTGRRNARLERALLSHDRHRASAAEPMATNNSPTDEALLREATLRLEDALRHLPVDYQRVIALRNAQGLSYAEIALEMGRSVDGVQKLWNRSLAQLRNRLKAID